MTVTADDLDLAVTATVATLRAAADRDWTARAGVVEATCRKVAEHIGYVHMCYAANIGARATTRYVGFEATVDAAASVAELLEFTEAGGRMLVAMVRVTGPEVRAFHPSGMADAAGFAGMGCVEALVHGHDAAQGLGIAFDPPPGVCARVVARMFPSVDAAGLDPWTALLWATGRIDVPGRDRVTSWRWRGAPPGEG